MSRQVQISFRNLPNRRSDAADLTRQIAHKQSNEAFGVGKACTKAFPDKKTEIAGWIREKSSPQINQALPHPHALKVLAITTAPNPFT
ncbi:hypothetical protein [Candidatus Phycosocius spiralis]|uniref:Uncharacterized protein n=1 Tax=Candidatus Phycosocius spiralis TaxID=2815099 RepID=A0ABQ4PTB3_9PROT|nr:hypothetical protein [Candidatus Phycosocius spiralis]GIU66144.1 hypothetical protein PsB1_0298 [Candidatus Phycosocius spiralis]